MEQVQHAQVRGCASKICTHTHTHTHTTYQDTVEQVQHAQAAWTRFQKAAALVTDESWRAHMNAYAVGGALDSVDFDGFVMAVSCMYT